MQHRRLLAETRALYAKADALWSRYSCPASGECCQLRVTGRQPWLWPSEWLLLKGDAAVPPPREDGACPYLDDRGRCSRYEHRPLGCRTFFCARVRGPSAQPVTEMNALLERIERINLNADEDAKVKPLLEWCA